MLLFAEGFEEEWRLFDSEFWCLRQSRIPSNEKREKGREMGSSFGVSKREF